MSFRWKLVITYILAMIVSITIIQIWSDSAIRGFLVNFTVESLRKDAAMLAGVIRMDSPASFNQLEHLSGKSSIRITLWDLEGLKVADSAGRTESFPGENAVSAEFRQAMEQGSGRDIRYDPMNFQKTLYIAERTADGKGVVGLSVSLEEVEGLVNDFRPAMLLVLLLLPLFGAGAVWGVSRKLGLSIERLVDASRGIASGEYVESIPSVPGTRSVCWREEWRRCHFDSINSSACSNRRETT